MLVSGRTVEPTVGKLKTAHLLVHNHHTVGGSNSGMINACRVWQGLTRFCLEYREYGFSPCRRANSALRLRWNLGCYFLSATSLGLTKCTGMTKRSAQLERANESRITTGMACMMRMRAFHSRRCQHLAVIVTISFGLGLAAIPSFPRVDSRTL